MSIDAVGFLPPLTHILAPPTGETAAASDAAGATGQFSKWFSEQLAATNEQLRVADHGVQQLAAGNASNLHQVMIDLEQAKLSMQLVMQVRNHLLEAYQSLMQMQM